MKNRVEFFFVAVITFLLFFDEAFSQSSYTTSIVRIYGYKNGRAKVGTGTFVDINGRSYILSCYHILSGCDKIEVRSSIFGLVDGISIVAYDNIKDLILLDYKKRTDITPYNLHIGGVPNNISMLKATTIGHPNSITEQRFEVRFTSEKGVIPTKSLFDNSGNAVFKIGRDYEFDVIPVDLTIYGGMSGAPVILNSFVIGILSGSINTGGSIAWAIPGYYCNRMSFLTYSLSSGSNLSELQSINVGNRYIFRSVSVDENLNSQYSPLEELVSEAENHLQVYLDYKSKQEKLSLEIIKELDKIAANPYNDQAKASINEKGTDYYKYQSSAGDYKKYIDGDVETAKKIIDLVSNYESSVEIEIDSVVSESITKKAKDWDFNFARLNADWLNKYNQIKQMYFPQQDYFYSKDFKDFLQAQSNADNVEKQLVRHNMKLIYLYKTMCDLIFEAKGISND